MVSKPPWSAYRFMLLPVEDKSKRKGAIKILQFNTENRFTLKIAFIIYLFVCVHAHVCACRYACGMVHMEVRRQFLEVGFLLSPSGIQV